MSAAAPTIMGSLIELAERLERRAKQDRSYAANNEIVAALLEPEYAKFDAREPNNTYAVRMQIDHRNSAKRDAAWADDLEKAAAFIRARATMEASNG